MTDLAARLRARIVAEGPLRLDQWMEACNAHYYATRDPFGAGGDFTTAPEISQMFGELVGAWVADLWARAGSAPFRLVELGPGRGTLMADALRVLGKAGARPPVSLVETSPVLRAAQTGRVPDALWHDGFANVPGDLPIILIANEFFDALPVRSSAPPPSSGRGPGGGSSFPADAPSDPKEESDPLPGPLPEAGGGEVGVRLDGQGFASTVIASDAYRKGEWSEPSEALAAAIGDRLRTHGGAALIIDYGYAGTAAADTVQAVRGHARADPFADPGESDLTAHVNFSALAAAAAGDVRVSGPVPQGVWLTRLGIELRAAALKARAAPTQAAAIEAALVRLTAPAQMGSLFKVMALTAPGWPTPAGFDA